MTEAKSRKKMHKWRAACCSPSSSSSRASAGVLPRLPPAPAARGGDGGGRDHRGVQPRAAVPGASVAVHVVVSNPSNAPYRYGETLTAVTYHGEPVGTTVVPAGEVGAGATARIEPVTVVDGLKVAENRTSPATRWPGRCRSWRWPR
ncbi:hypothetical protein GUJ93_ZPchr0007g3097 [Zizania palustris]|uniref:Late embryogenesis abundant protein LEA-2 subgroup domain-containing protein n=1 Tax=Zizania palustris TaxID=103762 RepID=A0A8J5TED7_ZIZPA|nr:hypothetical protein GUJ93_ZPchr0007g3097 [Zizania palustris]